MRNMKVDGHGAPIMKRHNKHARPLLVGYASPSGSSIRVWCSHCARYHKHGWSPDLASDDVESRCCHCDMDSPYSEGGYYIGIRPEDGYVNPKPKDA